MTMSAFLDSTLEAQRVLSKSSIFRANAALGYGLSIASFAIALILRFAIDGILPPGYLLVTFIPAVIISAFLAGSRPGALCALLSFVSVWYWFIDEPGTFSISSGGAVGLSFFVFIVVVDIVLIAAAASSVDRLATQQAQLTAILETVPVGIMMVQLPSGRLVGTNRHIADMFGSAASRATDVFSFSDTVNFRPDASATDRANNPLVAIMSGHQESSGIEVQYQRPDGAMAWVRILARPVQEFGANVTEMVICIIDIDTQYKNQIALEDALKTKELLLYEVNHRVKNSLHLVNSFLFFEAMKTDDSDAQSAIMIARSKVDKIARVHQLLYEGGAHDSVDMKVIIEEIVRDLLIAAGKEGVSLDLAFSGNLAINIRQASPFVLLVNEIVTNAIKYGLGSADPKLTVSAVGEVENMSLVIRDNGPGIPPLDPAKKPGLGSEIIEGLVNQMRGGIVVESDAHGTAIMLRVPTNP